MLTWKLTALASCASVALRMPMLWSPVSVDEGAYLATARAWSHGAVLYRDVFIDRPQGLFLLFRIWDWMSGGSTGSIRVLAMVFGVVLVASTGVVVREVSGHRAARLAVVLCAVTSAAPFLEGYAANTELLSGSVSAAGLAAGLVALSRPSPTRWFIGAGVLAGVALSIKQSGFDGLVALVTTMALIAHRSPSDRATVRRGTIAVSGGAAAVVALLAIHGALTGWSRWWFAVVGYRLQAQSVFSNASWGNLLLTLRYSAVILGGSAVLALIGLRSITRSPDRNPDRRVVGGASALVCWLLAASAAFVLGGGFWRHYWILFVAPLSALAGIGLAGVRRARTALLMLAIAPSLVVASWVYTGGRAQLNARAAGDHRAVQDLRVGNWFQRHRARGQSLYVLCSSAAAYADAHQDPRYPLLWQFDVAHTPNGAQMLVHYLSDPTRRPTYIAAYQNPNWCDPSGQVADILNEDYQLVAWVAGVQILEQTSSTPATDSSLGLVRWIEQDRNDRPSR